MPLYTYAPLHKTQVPRLGIAGPGEYEISEADAAELNGRIEGKDGAPALTLAGGAPKVTKGDPKPKAAKAPAAPDPGTETT
jgi:hypothetical protein